MSINLPTMISTIVLILAAMAVIDASSKSKPHGHKGVLEPYTGQLIPSKVSADQEKKLNKGESINWNERVGKSGRGVVIQDINASTTICMSRIRDLSIYPKVVPNVKKVEVYDTINHKNGTAKVGAKFDIGVLGMRFGYFLMLTHEPKYNTLTWTLDYRYNSDFDDNVGHWQVMTHPTKAGWARVLYSTKVKLFPWIPEFVVNFLTKKALTESTSWVKREAEKEQALETNRQLEKQKQAAGSASKNPFAGILRQAADATKGNSTGLGLGQFDPKNIKLPSWFNLKGGMMNGGPYPRVNGDSAVRSEGRFLALQSAARFPFLMLRLPRRSC